jgi:hypothetical protein
MKNKNFDTDKYRLRFPRIGTKAYPRVKAIEQISKWLANDLYVEGVKFDGKKISSEHSGVLLNCAKLWNKLNELENAVRQRRRKSKRPAV